MIFSPSTFPPSSRKRWLCLTPPSETSHNGRFTISFHADTIDNEWIGLRLIILQAPEFESWFDMRIEEQANPEEVSRTFWEKSLPRNGTYRSLKQNCISNVDNILPGAFLTVVLVSTSAVLIQLQPASAGAKDFPILYDAFHFLNRSKSTYFDLRASSRGLGDLSRIPISNSSTSPPPNYIIQVVPSPGASGVADTDCAKRLPLQALYRIAYALGSGNELGWHRTLFNFGLTCRSISPIVDMFFQVHNIDYDMPINRKGFKVPDIPSLLSVRRSLSHRPHRAHCMTEFSLLFYREYYTWPSTTEHSRYEILQAATHVLLAATRIKVLHIHPIPSSLSDEYFCALSNLTEVTICKDLALEMIPLHPFGTNSCSLAAQDVIFLLSRWPKLRKISMIIWREHPQKSHASICSDIVRSPSATDRETSAMLTSDLKELSLHLSQGHMLAGARFFHLFNTKSSSLTQMQLHNISGPSNRHFLACLRLIHKSIERIQIHTSSFLKADASEEYALDEMMSTFESLSYLLVDRTMCLSSRSISRKKPAEGGGNCHELCIMGASPLVTRDIDEALQTTGWNKISLDLYNRIQPDRQDRASNVAKMRGIELSWIEFNVEPRRRSLFI